MKAVVIYEAGGPKQLKLTEVPKPYIKEGWSLVKVKAFGLNHSEIFTRQGLSPSVKFPRILGIECVGEIVETSAPKQLSVGQRIVSIMGEMGRAFDGSYAEYVLLPNTQIYPVESDLSWINLATIPETYYTAYGSMLNLNLKPTDKILVRGATSGVGYAFMQLVKAQFPKIKITGTTRNTDKTNKLLEVGFDQVVIDQGNMLQTTENYTKIIELIGPASIKNSFQHLEVGGIICSSGQLGHQWYLEEFDPIRDIKEDSYLTSFYSGHVNQEKIQALFNHIKDYHVKIKPEKVFSLDEIQDAHHYLESKDSFGKVVIQVDEGE